MNMILNSTINAPTTQQNDRDVLRGEADKRAEDAGADADFTDEACSSDCDEPEATVPSASDSAFDRSFNSFDPSQKWRLASGRVVEDVLNDHYLEVRSDHVGHLVRDWVIDLENMTMKRWFTVEEWQEIMDAVPTLPPPTREFAQSLTRFHGVKTAEALRKVVMSTSFLPEGVSFNREAHFDLEWAHLVVHELLNSLRICETDSETIIVADQLEQWYCYHLWFLFDKLFLSLPRIILVRRESTCRASSLRKNRNRTETTARAKLGRRFDGILRSVEDHSHEFGALEAARQLPGGTETTKWMSDCRKLGRALRDMLSRLHEVVGHEPGVFEKLQVVGIFTAGRELRMCLGGYSYLPNVSTAVAAIAYVACTCRSDEGMHPTSEDKELGGGLIGEGRCRSNCRCCQKPGASTFGRSVIRSNNAGRNEKQSSDIAVGS
ncbi:hypothetical protein FN846DRAFT_891972 [Sphaerosporella brunnea]|uniref:Uncharacterized protein n=1 Tax=Sphaerosporella brunnea TaxID=1250544 RepID=A0A5J5EQW8_9PEZI|nr:hypothetical protein FN846DRAFT_891966 [Sphaerosporella brunnea]KAA8900885.1 hypothetical protein FN846DRAFT_891972 [Sphaerosporella brunnea]